MFKHVYFGLVLGSSLLGAVGIVQTFNTTGTVQKIAGTIGVGGATTALTALGLGIAYKSKEDALENDFMTQLDDHNKANNRQLAGLKLQIDELKSQIKVLEIDKANNLKQILELQQKLNDEIKKYFQIVLDKDLQIKSLEAVLHERDSRVEDFLQESKQSTVLFLNERYTKLDDLQKRLSSGLNSDKVSIANKTLLTQRIQDIQDMKTELTKGLEELNKKDIKSFNDVLKFINKFDYKFFTAKTHFKDLRRAEVEDENKTLITTNEALAASLNESIPRVRAIELNRQSIADVDAEITATYERVVNMGQDVRAGLLEMLEERNLIIEDLTQQIVELKKPLQAIGTSEQAQVANRVSNFYYETYQYKLDFITWDETEVGYTITYATRQNNALTNNELMVGNAKEQLARLTGALHGTFPEFTYNYQNCTIILTVIKRKPIKKDTSKADIDKIWKPVDKFESFVKSWERIRITGGSQAGKSPTAKNIALAIMKQRKDKGDINLYDPQGQNSKKDYWNMPKVGLTHADSIKGLKIVCDSLKELSETGNTKLFNLNIFDEIDSTIAEGREGSDSYYFFKDKLTYTLKQGSHQGVGCIIIGQSVDANVIPGMTWSDWNSTVQVHIGANAGLWLDKSTTVEPEMKNKLLEKYRKIQEYCNKKNDELGLDVFTDASAYRFALAVPLSGIPDFIQLPDFDSYDYYEVMADDESSEGTQDLIASVLDAKSESITIPIAKPVCPQCGSEKIGSKGKTYHRCIDCNKSWKK